MPCRGPCPASPGCGACRWPVAAWPPVVTVAAGYLWSLLGQQTTMLISFALLMLLGMALVLRRCGALA